MNKVIAINLGGNAYQLEESGYDALRVYLENAAARLRGNPDRDEIISDIEQAIAEKFRALLGSHKTVVETSEVTSVLAAMRPIEANPGETDDARPADAAGPGAPSQEPPPLGGPRPRRLYRIQDGAMVAGVCNGLAHYFNIDPTFVRLGFVALMIFWGTGLLLYVVLAIVVPKAHSPEEVASASGNPMTAQEFIRRAKEGYYKAFKGFPDPQARREWKRRFRREMRANAGHWRYNWHNYWAEHAPVHPGLAFTAPLFSLIQGALTLVWVCALISLLTKGGILGMALPDNVPVWLGALLLCLAYGALVAPVKIARRACYWGTGGPRLALPFVFLMDAVVWFAFVAVIGWLAYHYFPELREAVQKIPSLVHQASQDINSWWHNRRQTF